MGEQKNNNEDYKEKLLIHFKSKWLNKKAGKACGEQLWSTYVHVIHDTYMNPYIAKAMEEDRRGLWKRLCQLAFQIEVPLTSIGKLSKAAVDSMRARVSIIHTLM